MENRFHAAPTSIHFVGTYKQTYLVTSIENRLGWDPGAVEHKNTLSLLGSQYVAEAAICRHPRRHTELCPGSNSSCGTFSHIQSVYVTNYKTVITKNFALNKFTTKTFGEPGGCAVRWWVTGYSTTIIIRKGRPSNSRGAPPNRPIPKRCHAMRIHGGGSCGAVRR